MEAAAASSSSFRKLFQTLIGSSVRRCILSGVLCRLTISLKNFHDVDPPSVQISIADTGIGSTLSEFRELDGRAFALSDKWDEVLTITTTGVHDKEIQHYRLNLSESISSKTRLKRLLPTTKNAGVFSGTEVCLSAKEVKFDELIAWVVRFVQKMLVLKTQSVAIELQVDHIINQDSRRDHLLQITDNKSPPLSTPSIEFLISGLEDYVLKHVILAEENCQTGLTRREDLKVGSGEASSQENSKGTGQIVEVVVVITAIESQTCCGRANTSTTQVLYFQDFSPCMISKSSADALMNVDWQNYGLKLTGSFVDDDNHIVLQWEELPLFSHIDIAIHNYNKIMAPQARRETPSLKNLIKKAVKSSLDDLKTKYAGLFLSTHAFKVREYAPDLSKSLAGLIMSSNDLDFRNECAALLGLDTAEAGFDERVESCIREKIVGIVEMNDQKPKGERDNGRHLFEYENAVSEDCVGSEYDNEEEWSALDL